MVSMDQLSAESPPTRSPHRARRTAFLMADLVIAALLAAIVVFVVQSAFASAVAPFAPTDADGVIAEDSFVTLADEGVLAIARLDPALREAMRRAEADAAQDGVSFEVTSGWRSEAYQRWLLHEAVELYASEEVARQFVAAPERSRHVTGDAVDIGPLEAQLWLMEHGARYGICQTYSNERWHFELATAPGGTCPPMKADATG